MKEKFQEQGALYKEQRGILMEKHREMKTKLVQLRVEMQKAAIQQKDLQVEEDIVAIPDVSFDQELVVSSGDEEMKDPEEAKGEERHQEPCGCSSSLAIKTTEGECEVNAVTFNDNVSTMLYHEDDVKKRLYFATPLDSFGEWDSKPWALHIGDFVREAGRRLARKMTSETSNQDGHEWDEHEWPHRLWRYGNLHGVHDLRLDQGLPHGLGDGHQARCGEVQLQGAEEDVNDEWTIHSFGLSGGFLGRRSETMKGRPAEFQVLLRKTLDELWRDFEGEDATFTLPSPQPDPEQLGPNEVYVVLDFLPLDDPMHLGRIPTLCEIRGWGDEEHPHRELEGVMLQERTHVARSCTRCESTSMVQNKSWKSMHYSSWTETDFERGLLCDPRCSTGQD